MANSLMALIKGWFQPPPPPELTGKVYDYTRQRWGHAISHWSRRHGTDIWEIMGHGPNSCFINRLHRGDVITTNMESGQVARFRVNDIGYFHDPRDMFKAYVEYLDYHVSPTDHA